MLPKPFFMKCYCTSSVSIIELKINNERSFRWKQCNSKKPNKGQKKLRMMGKKLLFIHVDVYRVRTTTPLPLRFSTLKNILQPSAKLPNNIKHENSQTTNTCFFSSKTNQLFLRHTTNIKVRHSDTIPIFITPVILFSYQWTLFEIQSMKTYKYLKDQSNYNYLLGHQ